MSPVPKRISDAAFFMKGRVAFLTGGCRDIEAAEAHRLVASGARIAVADFGTVNEVDSRPSGTGET